jgi:hypothetical protein
MSDAYPRKQGYSEDSIRAAVACRRRSGVPMDRGEIANLSILTGGVANMKHSTNLFLNLASGCMLVGGLTLPAAVSAEGLHVGGENGGPSADISRDGGINASAGEGGPSAHVGSDGISASTGGEDGSSAEIGGEDGGIHASTGGEGGPSADIGYDGISAVAGEDGGSVEISDGDITVVPPPPPGEEPDGEEPGENGGSGSGEGSGGGEGGPL